jgi:uncharacterized membrane protein YphA (DoxX/SURF4 family)
MSIALLLARLFLAAILAAAGVGKLLDRAGSRAAVTAFGVPEAFADEAAVTLPVLELVAAVALLPSATALWGGVLATALMVAFSAVVARALLRGEQPDCHCFGQLHSEPISRSTLARNLSLIALSGFVVEAGLNHRGPRAVSWLAHDSAALLVGAGAGVAIAAILTFHS